MIYTHEERDVFAQMVYDAAYRDRQALKDYLSMFDAAYFTNFQGLITQNQHVVTTQLKSAEMKQVSGLLKADKILLPDMINKTEGYVIRGIKANTITVQKKDFGFSILRNKLYADNMEGVDAALKVTIQQLSDTTNLAALTVLGFNGLTSVKLVDWTDIKQRLFTNNALYNVKLNERQLVVASNSGLFKSLDDVVKDVCDAGKRLFKFSDKTRCEDYTMTKILTRVRHIISKNATPPIEITTGAISAEITDTEGNPVPGITVTIVERNIVIQVDDDAILYVDELALIPTDTVTLLIECDTYISQTIPGVKLEAGETTDLEITLISVPIVPNP